MRALPSKSIPREIAIENLRKIFASMSDGYISIYDAIKQWGRDPEEKGENNKKWIGTKIMQWKFYGLAEPVYGIKNSRKVLIGIRLTIDGKKELGDEEKGEEVGMEKTSLNPVDLVDVMQMVAKLRKEHPEFEIQFDVRLKD